MSRFTLLAALALCGGCVAPSVPSDPRHDVRQDLERHELAQRLARLERVVEAQGQGQQQFRGQVAEAFKQRDEAQRAGAMARGKAQAGPPK